MLNLSHNTTFEGEDAGISAERMRGYARELLQYLNPSPGALSVKISYRHNSPEFIVQAAPWYKIPSDRKVSEFHGCKVRYQTRPRTIAY